MKIFGREPVYILAFVAIALKLASAYWLPVSAAQQGAIMAVLSLVTAVVTAIMLKNGAVGAAILNLGQGVLALLMAFGLHMSAEEQANWMVLVEAAIALVIHPQVTAPISLVRTETRSPADSYQPAA